MVVLWSSIPSMDKATNLTSMAGAGKKPGETALPTENKAINPIEGTQLKTVGKITTTNNGHHAKHETDCDKPSEQILVSVVSSWLRAALK